MEYNLILAGVGGQGILTIAQAFSIVALRRGLNVKQSEVHGMSQRGGAVQSHLRMADHALHSDLVPRGAADMVLSVEPLEALRYVHYLSERGVIVSNCAPFVNIPGYPSVELTLDRISRFGRHVLVDAERLARAAGTARAGNMVMLGAAAAFVDFEAREFEAAIAELFERKDPAVVETNQRAFRFGRSAARAYRDGLRHGGTAQAVRHWIETLPVEQLAVVETPDAELLGVGTACELSGAETHAVAQTLQTVQGQGRTQLYEHEVYALVDLTGAISAPRHLFVPKDNTVDAERLARFAGQRVVLKVVSPDIVHKTEAGAVVFVPNDPTIVNREMDRLISAQSKGSARVEGVLVVEFVEHAQSGFGQELFVGIRSSRSFGAVIAAGLGGVDTEYLASKMRPGIAVAKALAVETGAEEFLELFKQTAAYDILAGKVRGHQRIVSDGELLRCFRAFIAIARRFCVYQGEEEIGLRELEINPFAFARYQMIPLDGRGQVGQPRRPMTARPMGKMSSLLEPRSIAIVGVSTRRANFGRIILNNIKSCGFPVDRLYVIKDGVDSVDGVRCVPSLDVLPEHIDLLVAATAAEKIPQLVDDVVTGERADSVIIIPGGLGEKEGTEDAPERIREAIQKARGRPGGGPIFLGPNCLGIRSRPGRYDTFFVPDTKLDPCRSAPAGRAALISQSGAFVISRMSNLELLNPRLAISIGNQIDLTVSDCLQAVGRREDIDCIGVYVEGFNDLDGLAFARAVEEVNAAGKVVVFYKAGRTSAGRSATMGHTASVAGDYDVCDAAVDQAGGIVVDTFKEFEQLMELATTLHGKRVRGRRIGAVSNAGYETVGMADAILGQRYEVEMADLSEKSRQGIAHCLAAHRLHTLVNVRNPLDLTPMANDQAYEECIRAMLEADEIDALVAACVPLTPEMLTTPEEIGQGGSLAERLPRIFAESEKPMIAVIDSGMRFDTLARAVRTAGVPVFRSCDQAIRSLGRYLCHRTEHQAGPGDTGPRAARSLQTTGAA